MDLQEIEVDGFAIEEEPSEHQPAPGAEQHEPVESVKPDTDKVDNDLVGVNSLSTFVFKNLSRVMRCEPLLTSEEETKVAEFSHSLKECLDHYGIKIPAFIMPFVHGTRTFQSIFSRRKRKDGVTRVAL